MTRARSIVDLLPAPAFRIALMVVLGIILGRETHGGPLLWGSFSAVLVIAIPLLMKFAPGAGAAGSLLAGLLLVSCGALRFLTASGVPPALPPPPFAVNVRLTGEVISPAREHSGRIAFTLLADSCYAEGRGGAFPERIAVAVRRMKRDRGPSPVSYGMRVILEGRVAEPPAERNPGEFNARAYYHTEGISGVLDVEGFSGVAVRDSSGGTWIMKQCVLPAREEILRRAGECVTGEEGEFLKDLLVGERSGMSEETREAFLDSGVAHVLAVSGYRVLVFTAMLAWALTLLRIPRVAHPFIAIPALLFYAALAGGHAPAVRAAVMAIVFVTGKRLERRPNSRNAVGVAALVVLGADPRQLFDAGFQLSFGAVLALVYVMPVIRSARAIRSMRGRALRAWVVEPAAVSLVVSAGSIPVTAACFGSVSVIGLLTNVVVVPATGAAMICGTIALVSGALCRVLGEAYGSLDGLLLHATIRFSALAASLPCATVETGRFGLASCVAWYAGMGLIASARQRRNRARCLALLLAALNGAVLTGPDPAFAHTEGLLRVSMIDVGQGDAFLVEFPGGRALLVDAGPRTLHADAGTKIVAPFLRRRGIHSIDLLVITHPDADHAGGAAAILKKLHVGRCAASVDSIPGVPLRPDSAWGGVLLPVPACARLYCLWPPCFEGPQGPVRGRASNNASVVCKLVYGEVSFLFTGDAEDASERGMVRAWGAFLRSTVLKVAHHGSERGTSPEFLDAVRPEVALVSVGAHNRYGHPSGGLLLRLSAYGVRVRRTDREGAVVIATDGKSVFDVPWRNPFP